METNTAAAAGGFSDSWDDEEVTVVEHWRRLPGKTLAPVATRDAYAGLTDTGIRAAFRSDTGATCHDLTAVSS
jgi:hypothetical protein